MQCKQCLAGGFRIGIGVYPKHVRAAIIPSAILANAVHQKLLPDLNPFLDATCHLVAARLFKRQDADRARRDPGRGAWKKRPALMFSDYAPALAQQLVPQLINKRGFPSGLPHEPVDRPRMARST